MFTIKALIALSAMAQLLTIESCFLQDTSPKSLSEIQGVNFQRVLDGIDGEHLLQINRAWSEIQCRYTGSKTISIILQDVSLYVFDDGRIWIAFDFDRSNRNYNKNALKNAYVVYKDNQFLEAKIYSAGDVYNKNSTAECLNNEVH